MPLPPEPGRTVHGNPNAPGDQMGQRLPQQQQQQQRVGGGGGVQQPQQPNVPPADYQPQDDVKDLMDQFPMAQPHNVYVPPVPADPADPAAGGLGPPEPVDPAHLEDNLIDRHDLIERKDEPIQPWHADIPEVDEKELQQLGELIDGGFYENINTDLNAEGELTKPDGGKYDFSAFPDVKPLFGKGIGAQKHKDLTPANWSRFQEDNGMTDIELDHFKLRLKKVRHDQGIRHARQKNLEFLAQRRRQAEAAKVANNAQIAEKQRQVDALQAKFNQTEAKHAAATGAEQRELGQELLNDRMNLDDAATTLAKERALIPSAPSAIPDGVRADAPADIPPLPGYIEREQGLHVRPDGSVIMHWDKLPVIPDVSEETKVAYQNVSEATQTVGPVELDDDILDQTVTAIGADIRMMEQIQEDTLIVQAKRTHESTFLPQRSDDMLESDIGDVLTQYLQDPAHIPLPPEHVSDLVGVGLTQRHLENLEDQAQQLPQFNNVDEKTPHLTQGQRLLMANIGIRAMTEFASATSAIRAAAQHQSIAIPVLHTASITAMDIMSSFFPLYEALDQYVIVDHARTTLEDMASYYDALMAQNETWAQRGISIRAVVGAYLEHLPGLGNTMNQYLFIRSLMDEAYSTLVNLNQAMTWETAQARWRNSNIQMADAVNAFQRYDADGPRSVFNQGHPAATVENQDVEMKFEEEELPSPRRSATKRGGVHDPTDRSPPPGPKRATRPIEIQDDDDDVVLQPDVVPQPDDYEPSRTFDRTVSPLRGRVIRRVTPHEQRRRYARHEAALQIERDANLNAMTRRMHAEGMDTAQTLPALEPVVRARHNPNMTRAELLENAHARQVKDFGDAKHMTNEELAQEFFNWTHRVNNDPDAIRLPTRLIPTDHITARYFREWRKSGSDQTMRLDEFIAKVKAEVARQKRARHTAKQTENRVQKSRRKRE
jgi:hypothetical protein